MLRSLIPLLLIPLGALVSTSSVSAASFDDTYKLFLSGKYKEAQEVAAAEVERGVWNRRWPELLIRCHLVRGQYDEALEQYDAALKRFPTSLSLRLLGIDAVRHNNDEDRVGQEIARFLQLIRSGQLQYASRDTLVAAGRYFAMRGEDARQVLEQFYDKVRDSDAGFLEAYIATAELAISKGDFAVAAETLGRAKRACNDAAADARVEHYLARAFENSDSQASSEALQAALRINPKHLPSLIMRAEDLIDQESYEEASKAIDEILEVNPKHPEAFALKAVLAHLEGDFDAEKKHRSEALQSWPKNPEVDHLIGRKLSQKYRFAEGAEYQRSALAMDSKHAGASFQLAQDLLRLGIDEVGWELAETVADEDPYNVVAYNLVTLRDRIKSFRVLSKDDIHVRMDRQESEIYGDAVLELLCEAKATLCKKYDMEPEEPIVVEIFPQQKDFAIRTFGLPGGEGFLGVCFGRVITANSPASQGARPANWKAVLWHEFCHVVTLEKTKNRMPRWLSEGISVYEERLKDPTWGQSMTPTYRQMILGGELTKVSELSSAFLQARSSVHLQFAYFESAMVIEYLVENHGHDALKEVLDALAAGIPINDALAASVGSLDKLDFQFAEYAKKQAENFAPRADWTRDGFPEKPSLESLSTWLKTHPDSYWGRIEMARLAMLQRKPELAKEHLEHLVSLGATTGEQGGVLEILAQVYQQMKLPKKEKEQLLELCRRSSDALPAHRRLINMAKNENDWESVYDHASKALAIQPLTADIHESMIAACQKLDQPRQALPSLRALAAMDPIDPAGLNYQTAKTLSAIGDWEKAKRHVLLALDEAPRYRDAHRLLLDIVEGQKQAESEKQTESKKTAELEKEAESANTSDKEEANGPDIEPAKATVEERNEKSDDAAHETGVDQENDAGDAQVEEPKS